MKNVSNGFRKLDASEIAAVAGGNSKRDLGRAPVSSSQVAKFITVFGRENNVNVQAVIPPGAFTFGGTPPVPTAPVADSSQSEGQSEGDSEGDSDGDPIVVDGVLQVEFNLDDTLPQPPLIGPVDDGSGSTSSGNNGTTTVTPGNTGPENNPVDVSGDGEGTGAPDPGAAPNPIFVPGLNIGPVNLGPVIGPVFGIGITVE